MTRFAEWLAVTPLSLTVQIHGWIIPTIQSIHIVAIGIVLTSVLMIDLRIFGWAGRDQTLRETTARFGPWLSWALLVLLVTGVIMVIGEPARELLAFSFWAKMGLVLVGTAVAVAFRRSLGRNDREWETSRMHAPGIKILAAITFLIWVAVVVLGRLIAYDHIWGAWSLSPQA